MSKLWQKETQVASMVEKFTIGTDPIYDKFIAPYDVFGSAAHAKMLASINLLTQEECDAIVEELGNILDRVEANELELAPGVEDIHSQIEMELVEKLGETGKKIHSGRSRNDQVLTAIKLYLRAEVQQITESTEAFAMVLLELSNQYKDVLIPGYTHLQVAMPSSFGLWLGAYAESLIDDVHTLKAVYDLVNKNPLGSAAGYGSSFPLNREMTTELLGFGALDVNVVYAQMSRGKAEKMVAQAIANVAATLSRLSMDVCLYMSQNFGFLTFPDELTTGSSIMPHKKNPDVFELVRGTCNKLQTVPQELNYLLSNLPSGYHREMQLTKESVIPAIESIKEVLEILIYMMPQMKVNDNLLADKKYQYLFTVEKVNDLVLEGVPFRDAYKQVGMEVERGEFTYELSKLNHTSVGSLGNLGNDKLADRLKTLVDSFGFETAEKALQELV